MTTLLAGRALCSTGRCALPQPHLVSTALPHVPRGPARPVAPMYAWRTYHQEQPLVVCAAAAEAAPALAMCARRLYLLHWNDQQMQASQAPAGPADATQCGTDFVETLQKQVKAMEKVAKKAVWFTTVAAGDGHQHVLMVTDNAKVARKYDLTLLPEDAVDYNVDLPGNTSVTVPVASILAAQAKAKGDSSDSESDDEAAVEMVKATMELTKGSEKKKDKKEKKDKDDEKDKEKEKKKDKKKKEAEMKQKEMTDESDSDEEESESGSDSDEDDKAMKGAMGTAAAPMGAKKQDGSGSESEESGSESESDSDAEECVKGKPAPGTGAAA